MQQGPLGWRGRSPLGGFFPLGETSGEEARARRRGPPVSDDGVAQTLWVPSSRPDGRAWSQGAGARPGFLGTAGRAAERGGRCRGRAPAPRAVFWSACGAGGFFSLWGRGLGDAAGTAAASGGGVWEGRRPVGGVRRGRRRACGAAGNLTGALGGSGAGGDTGDYLPLCLRLCASGQVADRRRPLTCPSGAYAAHSASGPTGHPGGAAARWGRRAGRVYGT